MEDLLKQIQQQESDLKRGYNEVKNKSEYFSFKANNKTNRIKRYSLNDLSETSLDKSIKNIGKGFSFNVNHIVLKGKDKNIIRTIILHEEVKKRQTLHLITPTNYTSTIHPIFSNEQLDSYEIDIPFNGLIDEDFTLYVHVEPNMEIELELYGNVRRNFTLEDLQQNGWVKGKNLSFVYGRNSFMYEKTLPNSCFTRDILVVMHEGQIKFIKTKSGIADRVILDMDDLEYYFNNNQ